MNKLAEKSEQALVTAIDNDDLVLPTLPEGGPANSPGR